MPDRRRRPPMSPDEMRRYLRYLVRSVDDIRDTLYALSTRDEEAIKKMTARLKRSSNLLEAAQRDALKT